MFVGRGVEGGGLRLMVILAVPRCENCAVLHYVAAMSSCSLFFYLRLLLSDSWLWYTFDAVKLGWLGWLRTTHKLPNRGD